MNRTLLAVLVSYRETDTLAVRFSDAVAALLLRVGVPIERIQGEISEMKEVAFGPTSNRRVLGCLNEAALELAAIAESGSGRFATLEEMEDHLTDNIYSTTKYQRPRDVAVELFRMANANPRG